MTKKLIFLKDVTDFVAGGHI